MWLPKSKDWIHFLPTAFTSETSVQNAHLNFLPPPDGFRRIRRMHFLNQTSPSSDYFKATNTFSKAIQNRPSSMQKSLDPALVTSVPRDSRRLQAKLFKRCNIPTINGWPITGCIRINCKLLLNQHQCTPVSPALGARAINLYPILAHKHSEFMALSLGIRENCAKLRKFQGFGGQGSIKRGSAC